MNKNEIKILKQQNILGKDFTVYGDVLEPLFLAKDIAEMIGHSRASEMLKTVDEDEKLMQTILASGQRREMWFLTEDGLYEVLMQSRKPIAKAFKKEVKAILKDLRTKGVVITESATDEAITFESVYGKRRVRKSIRESQDVRKLFEDYIELSSKERESKRLTNKDRINTLNIFIDELENKLANEALIMRGSELLATQELLTDIHKEKTRLNNKANGGIKSAQTKRINQLQDQLAMTQVDEDDYYLIESHPFSKNFQYLDLPNGKKIKTKPYRHWIENLHLEKYLPETYPGVDTTKPMRIILYYGHMERFDTINFLDAIVDNVADFYGFDDSMIKGNIQELHSYVDSYEEGYIFMKLENMTILDGDDTDKD